MPHLSYEYTFNEQGEKLKKKKKKKQVDAIPVTGTNDRKGIVWFDGYTFIISKH